jgi:cysteine desulfurase
VYQLSTFFLDMIKYEGLMIYLDYSASTPIDQRVAEKWMSVETTYFANANSDHVMGRESKRINDESIRIIADYFKVLPKEVIITSSAVESNNTAIKGLALKYPLKRHIISSALEHASLIGALSFLDASDYKIDTLPLDEEGLFDLVALDKMITSDTLLVTLIAVDSETGIRQPIEEAAKITHRHEVFFHTDLTQLVGKGSFDLTDIDMATASAHKVYGPKGVAVLIKKAKVPLIPLLHGGHSFTPYRASTPQNGLVAAYAYALSLSELEFDERLLKVTQLNNDLKEKLGSWPEIHFNSNHQSIPHLFNLSIKGSRPEEGLAYFSDHGLCFSSKSACSGQEEFSNSVYAITKDEKLAASSYRISLSHLTTIEELDTLVSVLKAYLKTL